MPMAKTFTLVYLVDDINMPSDMILTPNQEDIDDDEYFTSLFSLLEYDPGEDLVSRLMEKIV